jgi:probable HAF family extracellular repeat protein
VRLFRLHLLLALGLALASLLPAATAPSYSLVDLGLPGNYAESQAVALANSGNLVAGNLIDNSGFPHAFLYNGHNIALLPVISGFLRAEAVSMSDSGEIVGDLFASSGNIHAFSYVNGVTRDLGTLQNTTLSYAEAVNDSGTVVGAAAITNPRSATVACIFPSTNITLKSGYFASEAYSINSSGKVLLGQQGANGITLFFYASGNLTSLPIAAATPAANVSSYLLNNPGQVTGTLLTNRHPFLYYNSVVSDLSTIIGPTAVMMGLNNLGAIVGANQGQAFAYLGGANYFLGRLTITGGSGWVLLAATGINDSGQICGLGINPNDHLQHAFLLTPAGGGNPPAIATQPVNTSVKINATAIFKVVVKAALGVLFQYQWQRLPSGSSTWSSLANTSTYAGVATANLSVKNVTAAMANDQFRCIITNSGGATTSSSAKLLVETAPVFSLQPASTQVTAGTQAQFSVVATSYPTPTFQWQRLPAGSLKWARLANNKTYSGVGSSTLIVSNTTVSMSGDQFNCIAKNGLGSATSANATLTVTP